LGEISGIEFIIAEIVHFYSLMLPAMAKSTFGHKPGRSIVQKGGKSCRYKLRPMVDVGLDYYENGFFIGLYR